MSSRCQHKAVTVTSDDRCQHRKLLLLQAVAATQGREAFSFAEASQALCCSDFASFVALLLHCCSYYCPVVFDCPVVVDSWVVFKAVA